MAWKDATARSPGEPLADHSDLRRSGATGGVHGDGRRRRGDEGRRRPELGINVVDLGLVYDVHLDEGLQLRLDMTLTSAACP